MNRLPVQTWRCRVAALLDDPVAAAVLRRDGLTRESVFAQMEPIARWLQRTAPAPVHERQDAA
ncbi:hypothetical protein [Azospirillum sp. TSO22-1]|uniref:hypothetical protein n=1 Tax=Azospirillum sp. TSO22-1 TaxID=716789 RepID=UPI000D6138B1|nr:hypothetical protein [Azospirillum sp. TSO22-1]PWC44315.1 hypothetical protein TSO221_18020 [Azospirillum sp. TSO22-1]